MTLGHGFDRDAALYFLDQAQPEVPGVSLRHATTIEQAADLGEASIPERLQGIVGSDAGGTGGAHGGQTTKVIRAGEESGCRVADGPAPTGSWLFWLGLGLTARWRARRLRRPCRGSA